ncbi:tyrosine-protein phosphatase [Chitinophaga barathri]|uniref:Tyrosine-protein phosphatase n=1 Tax=Chitinophaga barathri TaxID=1647451 RepID=A0A3N4MAC1_9BACT|nr:tyrosine-protein phosphatase [Chitinophaga barathri]RPD38327.1 tyrosine-protein phosphatase [Chitinophaga barathri]
MKKLILVFSMLAPVVAFAQLADSTQRLVRMQGALNFRDVGGYKTRDGKTVVTGKVFRSADVSRLTDQDLKTLEEKHIHTVFDFRGRKEAAAAPDHILPGSRYTLCPAGSDSLPNAAMMADIIKQGGFLEKFYSNVTPLGERYKPLFQELLVLPANESVMYHCTGGRDRTGMATALFLYALQVPQDVIEADFTASNVYLAPMNARMFQGLQQMTGMTEQQISKAMALKPEHLRSMFNSLKNTYGSVENFFSKELGIGEKELRTLREKYTM